MTVKISSSPL